MNQIWKAINTLRGSIDFDSAKDLILTLLCLKYVNDAQKKDNEPHNIIVPLAAEWSQIQNKITTKGDLISIIDALHSLEEANEVLQGFFSNMDLPYPTRHGIPMETFSNLFNELSNIDFSNIEFNFQDVFDEVLYSFMKYDGRSMGNYILPKEVSRFMILLAEIKPKQSIYNPYAGIATFGVLTNTSNSYFGQEINNDAARIAIFRLFAYQKFNHHVLLDDSVKNWNPGDKTWDLIISAPPFKEKKEWRSEERPFKDMALDCLNAGMQSLNKNGRMICLVGNYVLFDQQSKEMRKEWIEKDLLEMVISLPDGLLPNTNIPFSILVLNKVKKNSGMFHFIKAEKYVDEKNPKERILYANKLINDIKALGHKNENIHTVDKKEVIDFDYNLNVPRYFLDKIEGTKLRQILLPIKASKGDLPETGRVVQIKNLKNDTQDFSLAVSDISQGKLDMPSLISISESCLLLSNRWKSLKPTYFVYDSEPIFIGRDIFSFRIEEDQIDIEYLVNELHTDYVLDQVEALSLGTTIPFIRLDDLREVVIKLPSLREQRAKVAGYNEARVAAKVKEAVLEAQKHGFYKQYFQEVANLKHALGKPLLNINSSISNLKNALIRYETEGKIISMESLINESFQYTFNDQFGSIIENLNHISTLLEKSDYELDLHNYPIEPVDIILFLNRYLAELEMHHSGWFEISRESDASGIDHNDFDVAFIMANKNLLKVLFDNVFNNILRHGFTNREKKYLLIIYIGIDQQKRSPTLEIEIVNDGNPFPENFKKEKFIQKSTKAGLTGNTGLGGFQINEITKHLSGEFELLLDPESPLPVNYTFYFPISELKLNEKDEIQDTLD